MKKNNSSRKRRPHAETTVREMTKALKALPMPARAIVNDHIKDLDEFRQQYPRLYELIFKNVDTKHYREFERHLERAQKKRRTI